jgi:hypothetical protein
MFQTLLFTIFIVQAKADDINFLLQTDTDNANTVSNNKYNRASTTFKLLNIDHSFTFGTYESKSENLGPAFLIFNYDGTGLYAENTDTGGDPNPISGFIEGNKILFKIAYGNSGIMTAKIINQNTIVIENTKLFLTSRKYVDVKNFYSHYNY